MLNTLVIEGYGWVTGSVTVAGVSVTVPPPPWASPEMYDFLDTVDDVVSVELGRRRRHFRFCGSRENRISERLE